MKKLLILGAIAAGYLFAVPAHAQMMLQKAVIASGGSSAASNSASMQMGSTAGQPVVGVASNGQMIAHFGFWTPSAAGAAVQPHGPMTDLSIDAWPNPATSESKITVTVGSASNLDVRLFNVTGAEVRNVYSGAASVSRSFDLDLTGLPPGSYILAARIPGQLVEKRISVIR